jgi:two-component system CheB/CheR fusion protein
VRSSEVYGSYPPGWYSSSAPGKARSASSSKRCSLRRKKSSVGIGASAGGLEAFLQLLAHLPATTGMAYVFVQHLDPSHESFLPALLARVTTMPVREVRDVVVVCPNQVYVIAPNTTLTLEGGRLLPLPRMMTNGQHLSIDRFLCSLAADRHRSAIGVLLSGTASDSGVPLLF